VELLYPESPIAAIPSCFLDTLLGIIHKTTGEGQRKVGLHCNGTVHQMTKAMILQPGFAAYWPVE
jgi:hypothetical protein